MAWDISDSELSQLTTDYILSATPVDQWMTATPLLSMLRGRLEVRHEGGEEFFEPLLVTKNTWVGSYSDYDAFDISPVEQMKGARWPVKSASRRVSYHRHCICANSIKTSAQRINPRIEQRMEETNLGRIEVAPTAIASLASQAVLECYGLAGVSS